MRDGNQTPAGWSLLVLALLCVMGFEMLHQFQGSDAARWGAHLAMSAVVLTAWPRLGMREFYLLSLSAILALLLWQYAPQPIETARAALDQAVFLMAFLLLISLIQEGALTSRSVEQVGLYLSQQPGGRRYTGLYSGTNFMAVIFNVGTLSLLAPLIRKAEEAGPDNVLTKVRARRQYNAVLRGFAWSVVWSPTAIAPLALLGLIDGIERLRWIALGFLLSVAMLFVGWMEDHWRWRKISAAALGLPPQIPPPFPRQGVWRFLVVCVTFGALTAGILFTTGAAVTASLILAAPMVLIGWLIVQNRSDRQGSTSRIEQHALSCRDHPENAIAEASLQPLRPTGNVATRVLHRLQEIATSGLPRSATASITLACAGFVGISAATLVPAEDLARIIDLDAFPAWFFMLSTTLAVTLLSQFGLSPIMMSVFFGAVLGSLPSLPADPTLTAVAVATGWAVSTTISPFATGVIFLARVSGHSTTKLTYNWNGPFTMMSIVALAAAYWIITGGT